MPPRPAGRGLGHLRALPRRHRLGDHARGRRARSARTRTCTAASWPTSTPASSRASFARGARFQPDPATGEARTCGTAASLAGLESALDGRPAGGRAGDPARAAAARARLRPRRAAADLHGRRARAAQRRAWAEPAHADDNRWMHRPLMDWEAAERRHDPASVEGRLWAGLQRLVAPAAATRAVHVQGAVEPLWTGNDHVFGALREHAGEPCSCWRTSRPPSNRWPRRPGSRPRPLARSRTAARCSARGRDPARSLPAPVDLPFASPGTHGGERSAQRAPDEPPRVIEALYRHRHEPNGARGVTGFRVPPSRCSWRRSSWPTSPSTTPTARARGRRGGRRC